MSQQRTMNSMPLLQHLRVLKAAIPVKQNEPQRDSQLPIFRRLKDLTKSQERNNSGIFQHLSFCIPLQDPSNDPSNEEVTKLVKGLFMQGAKIVQFNDKMSEQFSEFIVISQKSSIPEIRDKLRGKVKYKMILSYNFIVDSLKKLKKMNYMSYLLYDNTENMNRQATSSELAKERLRAEKLDSNFIRPKFVPKDEDLEKAIQNSFETFQGRRQFPSSMRPSQKERQWTEQISYEQFCQKGLQQIEKDQDKFSDLSESHDILQVQQLHAISKNREIKQLKKNQVEIKKVTEMEHQSQLKQQFSINPSGDIVEESAKVTNQQSKQKKREKIRLPQRYHRNQQLKRKDEEQKPEQKEGQPQKEDQMFCPWEPKGDKKLTWYVPPKNLASHTFKKNLFICDKLSEMQQIYQRNGDTKNFIYLKAIAVLKSHNKQIKSAQDLDEIDTLSKGMKDKIKEILTTGHLSLLNKYSVKEEINVCKELEKVWGIGAKKAKEFYDIGIKTVADLRKRPELISKNMAVGLKYFEEFSKRIPREKVTRIFAAFKKTFYALVCTDKIHYLEVVGSYRRGKATCGDIDILICRHDGSVESKLLQTLVSQLQQSGFISDSLSHPRPFDGRNCSAYMGVCYFEGEHHRIDIKHYPVQQYAFALMYFTGSDLFNRQMRMVAHNKGLLLSDHGIKRKERNGQKKIWKGGAIPVLKTEEEIFAFLGQAYCSPPQRQI